MKYSIFLAGACYLNWFLLSWSLLLGTVSGSLFFWVVWLTSLFIGMVASAIAWERPKRG